MVTYEDVSLQATNSPTLLGFVRNSLDFHVNAGGGEAGDHGGARRFGVTEELAVDRVHGSEIVGFAEKDAASDDVAQRGAATFGHGADVVHDLAGWGWDFAS